MTFRSLTIALIIVAGVSVAEEAAPSNQQKDLPSRLWTQKRDVQFGVAIAAAPLRQTYGIARSPDVTVGKIPPQKEFRANLRRLGDLSLEWHVTEADVRMRSLG